MDLKHIWEWSFLPVPCMLLCGAISHYVSPSWSKACI